MLYIQELEVVYIYLFAYQNGLMGFHRFFLAWDQLLMQYREPPKIEKFDTPMDCRRHGNSCAHATRARITTSSKQSSLYRSLSSIILIDDQAAGNGTHVALSRIRPEHT